MSVQVSIRNPDPPVKDSVFDMFRLDGRTIIITGGTGGIGYEVARGLAEAGANVSTGWRSLLQESSSSCKG
jgi:sorbose reductase